MCSNTVPSVTLQTAVLMQTQEFAKNNQTFSVHDITRAVRHKTSVGDLEIPEVEVQGASFRFDIPHGKVKALFDDLWRTGVFDPDFTLTRNFNGKYFEYVPTLTSGGFVQPTVATVAPAPVASATNASNIGQPWSTGATIPVASTPVVRLDQSSVAGRVTFYLGHCKVKGYRPTLKQVQSAIKRDRSTGWTCDELRDLIEKNLGYTVVDDPNKQSSAQVVV